MPILLVIDIPGIIIWTITILPVMLATFYYIDIPGIINLCFYRIVAMHIIILTILIQSAK